MVSPREYGKSSTTVGCREKKKKIGKTTKTKIPVNEKHPPTSPPTGENENKDQRSPKGKGQSSKGARRDPREEVPPTPGKHLKGPLTPVPGKENRTDEGREKVNNRGNVPTRLPDE